MSGQRDQAEASSGGVLIVIPCLNEVANIASAATSALNELTGDRGTVVVADGGSTDGTLDVLLDLRKMHPELLIIDNPKRIQSAGVNAAVQAHAAGHDYLLRMDAHGAYPAGYTAALVRELESSSADSVVVTMNTVAVGSRFQSAVALAQNSLAGNGGARHRTAGGSGRWVEHGHHALFRTSAFRAVGGYDETFSHNEDAELDIRLRRAGFRIWLAPAPSYTYYPRRTPSGLADQYFRFGQGRAKTVLRHHQANLRQLVVAPVLPAVLLALLAPRSRVASAPLGVWLAAVVAASHASARKSSTPEKAQVVAAVGIMHVAWSAGFWRHLAGAAVRRLRRTAAREVGPA